MDCFCYLGSFLTRECNDNVDVDARINLASRAFGKLRKCLFASTSISYKAKKFVYECLILAILLYGAEHWCLTESLFRKLRVFHARCVRAMCRVNRLHTRVYRIRTSDLLNRLSLQSIDSYVNRRQLRWLGHVARMEPQRLPRKMLTSWVPSKRPRGAPNFTYGRGIYKCLRKVGLSKNDWYQKALNRLDWRRIISSE